VHPLKVLIAGESWISHSIHQKGVDSFTTTVYEEGIGALRDALRSNNIDVDYQPAHIASTEFPATVEALSSYDCVVLSDIGANTLLLHPDLLKRSACQPNRLRALAEYVRGGGGLVMIGGYMTFGGIEGKARWHGTPVEDVLPVTVHDGDDRVEEPSGVIPVAESIEHPVLAGIDGQWPALLGYNRVVAEPDAQILARVGNDPLIVVGTAGNGRSSVFSSDCSPHWAPATFLEWPHYGRLWSQLISWTAAR